MTPDDIPAVEALLGITWQDDYRCSEVSWGESGWARVEVLTASSLSLGVVVRASTGADWAVEN